MAWRCLLGHASRRSPCSSSFSPISKIWSGSSLRGQVRSVRAININVEECVTNREKTLAQLSAESGRIVAEDRSEW